MFCVTANHDGRLLTGHGVRARGTGTRHGHGVRARGTGYGHRVRTRGTKHVARSTRQKYLATLQPKYLFAYLFIHFWRVTEFPVNIYVDNLLPDTIKGFKKMPPSPSFPLCVTVTTTPTPTSRPVPPRLRHNFSSDYHKAWHSLTERCVTNDLLHLCVCVCCKHGR